jgi:uncharacterized hydrophobic protein (TIGR00271 family)
MTFHIRLVSPGDLTEHLVEVLLADSGVSNLVVLTGSARRPEGDAVQFDVPACSANVVLRRLEAFADDRRGPITIQSVDAAIGEQATPPPRHRLVQRDIAPVWDVVEAKIRSDAVYAPSFYILLAIAGLIGAVGILTNSQILIVGAMVVGPEYNAIMGIALGIDQRNTPPIVRGALALLAGFTAAIIVTLIFGLAIRWAGRTPEAYSLGVRPVSSLIDEPNLFSLIVAVLAGIVGVVSLTEAGSRPHRRLHLRHDNPGRRRHRPLNRLHQLDRGQGVSTSAAPERDSAHRDRGTGPAPPADYLASTLTPRGASRGRSRLVT